MKPGDQVGPYRVIGEHPGGGYRGVSGARRVRIHPAEAPNASRAELDHPGIAQIVDRGPGWFATELADGVPLSEILARRTLAVDEALELVRDLALVLRHVHAQGIVHDALAPDAVIVCTGARAFPIQLGGWSSLRTGDGAQDIHALGVLAYRGITGRSPGLYPPELVPGISGTVSALIVRMLAVDPTTRPTAEAIVSEIAILSAGPLTGPRFARPRWTPTFGDQLLEADAIVLPLKRV